MRVPKPGGKPEEEGLGGGRGKGGEGRPTREPDSPAFSIDQQHRHAHGADSAFPSEGQRSYVVTCGATGCDRRGTAESY